MKLDKGLVEQASKVIDRAGLNIPGLDLDRLTLFNSWGIASGTLTWDKTHGFELIADVESFGPCYPATMYEPAEQVTYPVGSLNLVTHKIQVIVDALAEEGFTL